MKKYLCTIMGLIAICGRLQADPVSPYCDNYRQFTEETIDIQQNARSIIDLLIPQEEREMWSITFEGHSKHAAYLELSTRFGPAITVRCSRTIGPEKASYFCYDNYIDEYGCSHTFSMPDEYQVIEETSKEGGAKSIYLTAVGPDFNFYIEYDTFHVSSLTEWESVRDLWVQRLVNLQIPTQFQKNESTN